MIATPIVAGSAGYLDWVSETCDQADAEVRFAGFDW